MNFKTNCISNTLDISLDLNTRPFPQCLPCPSSSARSWSWRRSRGTRWEFTCASPVTAFRPRSANVFLSTFIVSNSDYRSGKRSEACNTVLYFDSTVLRNGECNPILRFRSAVSPVIRVPNQLVGAPLGTDVVLECFVEASPKSINYWVKDKGEDNTRVRSGDNTAQQCSETNATSKNIIGESKMRCVLSRIVRASISIIGNVLNTIVRQ